MYIKNKRVFLVSVSLLIIGVICGFFVASKLRIDVAINSSNIAAETQTDHLRLAPSSFAEVVKRAYPSVVNINTTTTVKSPRYGVPFQRPFGSPFDDFFDQFFGNIPREYKRRSLGSGVIISPEGYIITNNHVVEKADKIRVSVVDKQTYNAKIVGKDQNMDIALLKIEPKKPLSYAVLGDSDKIDIGEWVLAIGNPMGLWLQHTVTAGIISAKGRSLGLGGYEGFLQTDASINPGNSGGPLVNLNGEVIGINTAILANAQGIGFAIPINIVRTFLPQLKKKGHIDRGWIGVSIQEISPEIRDAMKLEGVEGVLVADVVKGGPAEKAGIERGDIIVEFSSKKVDRLSKLPLIVSSVSPGSVVSMKVLRDGTERAIKVKVGLFPDEGDVMSSSRDGSRKKGDTANIMGMTLAPVTEDFAKKYDIKMGSGLVVLNVAMGSEAEFAGIRPGDVILEVNRRTVDSIVVFEKIVKSQKPGSPILFLLKRGNTTLYLSIRRP